jgi:hypothetical protein
VLGKQGRTKEGLDVLEATIARAIREGEYTDEKIEAFDLEVRLTDLFMELPREFVRRDPELEPLRRDPAWSRIPPK